MFIYFLIAMLSEMFSLAFGLFPAAASFLPLPSGVNTAFQYAGEVSHYVFSIAGDDVATAIEACLALALPIGIAIMTYRVLNNFRIPVISRFTHGQPVKES